MKLRIENEELRKETEDRRPRTVIRGFIVYGLLSVVRRRSPVLRHFFAATHVVNDTE